jgi:ABC-type dipeptide/oligopeptide/nickel transport system ATPase component
MAMAGVGETLLEVEHLSVELHGQRVLDDVSFSVRAGETLALVGETGSGKTMTARAILQLLAPPVRIAGGTIRLDGRELLSLSAGEMRQVRGRDAAMIFQNPQASLHPMRRIGTQMIETVRERSDLSKREAGDEAAALLGQLRLVDPARVMASYPHQLSGGMCQRVMIALAVISRPKLLIADEATTALDTITQAHILGLLQSLLGTYVSSILFITHDLRIVEKVADRTAVLRDGKIVAHDDTRALFEHATEPYTRTLLQATRKRTLSAAERRADA